MDKTEKRTAEEIMYSHFQVKGKIDMIKNQFIGLGAQSAIIKAMHEYAAQELDAYKARLKNTIAGRNDYFILLDIIDTA